MVLEKLRECNEVHAVGWTDVNLLTGVFRWTYADPSWARIAALVPEVVSCAEGSDEVANEILVDAVQELALSVKAVVQRLGLCGEGAKQI